MHLQGIGTTVPIPFNGLVYRNSRKTIDFNRWIEGANPKDLLYIVF